MLAYVVGCRNVDYVSKKTGNPVKGLSLYLLRDPNSRESDVDGQVTDNVFISDRDKHILPETITCGLLYDFQYESDGRYSYLVKVSEVVPDGD